MLAATLPIWVAVAVSSLLFGVWHVGAALEDHAANRSEEHPARTVAATVAFTSAAGVGFCVLRLLSGSLLPPLVLHWAANGSGLAAGWFLRTAQPADRPGSAAE
jgi:membrane protease YdiL (CAAX protease family)